MARGYSLARVAAPHMARGYSLSQSGSTTYGKGLSPSQRWALPLQRLIANCVQVHVGEKGKNGAHAFAAVVHLHVCSGWGRCCGAGTQSYLSTTHSRTHSRTRSRIQGRRRSRTRGSISCWRRRGCYRHASTCQSLISSLSREGMRLWLQVSEARATYGKGLFPSQSGHGKL